MPGAYAHLTLVNLAREPARLEANPAFPLAAIAALGKYLKYLELGAVSPDYPYLAIGSGNAKQWADLMHYDRTGEVVHAAVGRIRTMGDSEKPKALAWLLGYAAHVVADVTIHPVVELKVGTYDENKGAHRTCEMHQDAWIFRRLNLGGIGISEHLDSGVCACGSTTDPKRIDPVIEQLWSGALRDVHPWPTNASAPDLNLWHAGFRRVVDSIEDLALLPIARHVAPGLGIGYPSFDKVETQYISALKTPEGPMHYDAIFDRAIANVVAKWAAVARGALGIDKDYLTAIGNWNLDTGKDAGGKFALWRNR
jgi:hypothetical protein